MLDLIICSVSYNSSSYLRLNRQLTVPTVDWLVVQNGEKDKLTKPEFIVLDGVPRPKESYDGFIGTASFHHAAGLNKACEWLIQNSRCRYILFLDPDFFIIPSLDKCIEHMKVNDLAFFGAPYTIDPKKPRIQDFPVAFCMFVDTYKVPLNDWNFLPKSEAKPTIMKDTGYQIYSAHKGVSKHDIVLPNIDGKSEFVHTNDSLLSAYGIVPAFKCDQYFWQDKLFGVHFHAKLHLRKEQQVIVQSAMQTTEIKKIVKHVRSYDSTL